MKEPTNDFNAESFVDLYQTMSTEVQFLGIGRSRPRWLDQNGFIIPKQVKGALMSSCNRLAFLYQGTYVRPLADNLDMLIEQLAGSTNVVPEEETLETLVGAVCDHVEGEDDDEDNFHHNLSWQIQQLLAVVSNFYRTFLRAPQIIESKRIRAWIPPLATFKYQTSLLRPPFVPFTIPAAETRQLFGASVGVVSVPSTYRQHPILWAALAHETAGHDVLWAVDGLLPELETSTRNLFGDSVSTSRQEPPSEPFVALLRRIDEKAHLLGHLWRYWIGEAAADILGILNMGPAFAINSAIHSSVLIRQILMEQMQLGMTSRRRPLREQIRRMKNTPVLRISPPPPEDPGKLEDIDSHPPDVLRLAVMLGSIQQLTALDSGTKQEYVRMIEQIITLCSEAETKALGGQLEIKGYLQTGSDVWETLPEGRLKLPVTDMILAAQEVGRHVVTQPLEAFGKCSLREVVKWDDLHETPVKEVARRLLEEDFRQEGLIDSVGDDGQLLAGCTMALLKEPLKYQRLGRYTPANRRSFYRAVNDRLSEAIQRSFDRDEVWGDTVLSPAWITP